MKILVTGADGFIGRALSHRLERGGHEVTGIDLADGKIQAKQTLETFQKASFDHVFHLAAHGAIQESWDKIPEYIERITLGTSRVMQFCKDIGASYTYISSYMYGMPEREFIDETHPISTVNPYALSKRLSEKVCQFYSSQLGVKGTIIRPFVIFGPGLKESFLIPSLIKQVIESETIVVRDLTPRKRDFLFIEDFIDVIEKTINPIKSISIFNVGMGKSYTIQELINLIQDIAGTEKPIENLNQPAKNEYPDVFANIDKVKKELQWEPKFDMRRGLKRYIEEIND
jgi:GDP-4-dehydro-6-deoxy-D-mannose reductase